jgi:catechol 2,3-dioxygenase-like lactoylglutathione lyase family enzyme
MIEGLSHITIVVKDLDRTAAFLKAVFDAEEVYASGDETHSLSKERFFLIGDVWLAAMEGEPLGECTYNHIAFKIPEEDFEAYVVKVKAAGAGIRPGRGRTEGEGRSVYFYGPDNHLFELHTGTLHERLDDYRGKSPKA